MKTKGLKKQLEKAIDAGIEKIDPSRKKSGTKKKVAAVAGLATAGVIGAAALARRSDNGATFHVVPDEEKGWALTREGSSKPVGQYSRKRAALSAGRKHARKASPSTLFIHNTDGKLAKSHSYDAKS